MLLNLTHTGPLNNYAKSSQAINCRWVFDIRVISCLSQDTDLFLKRKIHVTPPPSLPPLSSPLCLRLSLSLCLFFSSLSSFLFWGNALRGNLSRLVIIFWPWHIKLWGIYLWQSSCCDLGNQPSVENHMANGSKNVWNAPKDAHIHIHILFLFFQSCFLFLCFFGCLAQVIDR